MIGQGFLNCKDKRFCEECNLVSKKFQTTKWNTVSCTILIGTQRNLEETNFVHFYWLFIYEAFWGWEMKQPLIPFGDVKWSNPWFRPVIHPQYVISPDITDSSTGGGANKRGGGTGGEGPGERGQGGWEMRRTEATRGTNGCLKRKVFFKNQKHEQNSVEITHLCIMHRLQTQRVHASTTSGR